MLLRSITVVRKLDSHQKAQLVEFLEGLYAAAGYTTQKRWSEEGDYHATNLSTAMNRSVPDGIDGYTLLKLITAAAARAEESPERLALRTARDGPVQRDQSLHSRLEAIAEGVAEVGATQDEVLTRLQAVETEVRRLQPPAAPRRSRKAAAQ